MNKFYLFLLLLFFLIFSQIYLVKKEFIIVGNKIREVVNTMTNSITSQINLITNVKKEIEYLKKENKILNQKLAKCYEVQAICKNLREFKFLNLPSLYFVKAISYASLPNFSEIYVSYPKKISIPRGLVYNNFAAGIVVKNFGDYSLAYLNQNPKVSYTVMIGEEEVPGIFYGGEMKIKYIQKFAKIKVGDIVKTSGLDKVFYKGALVGKVVKIENKKLYKEAIIKPYYNKLTPSFFYVVEGRE